jgi:putative endonuclease
MEIASKKTTSPLAILGDQGEAFTVEWLKKNKYTILACNYRTKYGEIDIIAQQKDVIAFIEVKLRSCNYFNLSEVITYSKQKKIIATAQHYYLHYLQDKGPLILRFDVALLHTQNDAFSLEYIPNAFTKQSNW